MRAFLSWALLLAALSCCAVVRAKLVAAPGEQVTSFQANIVVNPDATLTVFEDFVIHSEGSYFKYGFIRHLPIDDEARWDERYAGKWKDDNGIRIRILELTEDGSTAKYTQSSGFGYPQLRIGTPNVPLAPGDHHYAIRYAVDGALSPGLSRDTLYWNAIGHYWSLPIANACVTIRLPAGVTTESITSTVRVGGRGVSNNAGAPGVIAGAVENGGPGVSYCAKGLRPTQSLSLVVTWPAGFVKAPSLGIWNRDKWYLIAPAVLCLYYFIVWLSMGRKSKAGTIVVRYEPPSGISPAAARYLITTGTDGRSLAAVIAALAARHCLRVEPHDGVYRLTRLSSDSIEESKLAREERYALQFLFEDGPVAEISPSTTEANVGRNSRYVANLQQDLAEQFEGRFFTRQIGYIALGVLATFVMAFSLAATAQGRDTGGVFFMTTWLLFCSLALGAIVETGMIPAWKNAMRGMAAWSKLLPATGAVAVFGFFFGVLLSKLAQGISPAYAAMVGALAMVTLIWAPFLKRITKEGQATLDAIAGFRQFLDSVEQDRLRRLNESGSQPPAEIEYLPYAIALEIREAWGDHLADTFFAATIQR